MAAQIATIFRGAALGDVAIELPTLFDFAVNQKIAKSLPARRDLRGQDFQGRQASRPADRGADPILPDHQPADREITRPSMCRPCWLPVPTR
jgi:hypothetical protein